MIIQRHSKAARVSYMCCCKDFESTTGAKSTFHQLPVSHPCSKNPRNKYPMRLSVSCAEHIMLLLALGPYLCLLRLLSGCLLPDSVGPDASRHPNRVEGQESRASHKKHNGRAMEDVRNLIKHECHELPAWAIMETRDSKMKAPGTLVRQASIKEIVEDISKIDTPHRVNYNALGFE
ncbi:hypothetical protein AAMO2058_000725000 [Amorphochlora amoebiformis]